MYTYRGKVKRVIDGDTIVVDIDLGFHTTLVDTHIRVANIDTPECRTKNLAEKEHGLQAKKYVEGVLGVGTTVTLHTYKDKSGKFGRWLADVETEMGLDLRELLVERGFEKKEIY